MANNQVLAVQNLLAYTLVQDRNSLLSLLERNGVKIPTNAKDTEVTMAVLMASSKSQNFKNELIKLLSSKVKKAASEFSSFVGDSTDFGFTGLDDFSFTGIDDFAMTGNGFVNATATERRAARVTAENPQGKSGVGLFFQNLAKSATSQDTLNAGLNIGLTAINNKVSGKQNALQTEANTITQRQDEVRQTLSKPAKGSNTLTYVFVGVGILALGAIIYFVVKKK